MAARVMSGTARGAGRGGRQLLVSALALCAACLALRCGFSFVGADVRRGIQQRDAKGMRLAIRQAMVDGVEVSGDLQPLSSYILIKSRESLAETKGGILLPESVKEKPCEGEVLAVGPGSINRNTGARNPVWVKPGMQVLYGKYGQEKVTIDDVEHVLIREDSVLLSYSGDAPTLDNLQMPWGKVLVELPDEQTETTGGLLLSKGASKADTTLGEIVAASDGVVDPKGEVVSMDLSVGDKVRFRYGNEVKLEVGKKEYRTVQAEDCIAKWAS